MRSRVVVAPSRLRPLRRLVVIAFFLAACDSQTVTCPNGVLVVTSNERDATQVGVLPLDGRPAQMLPSSVLLGSDPALATSAGRRFVINRSPGANDFFEVDSCGNSMRQFSALAYAETGDVDPQDVAVAADGTPWVARLLSSSLLVRRPVNTLIDLSKLDPDGNPDMSSIRIVGNQAFVALERLTNDVSQQPSQLAVLDTTSLNVVKVITLHGRNPFGLMVESPGELWLAEPGNFADSNEADAGIEVVDTNALTSSLLISETTLQASVVEVAVSPPNGCGAAIVADATVVNHTSLVSFSLDGSNVATALGPTDGFDLRALAWTSDGKLLVGDARPTTGGFPVHVFTTTGPTCALAPGADLILPDLPAVAFAP